MTKPPAAPPPLPKPMRFVKDFTKVFSKQFHTGVEVEAWPCAHVAKCYNVRLKSDAAVALLTVPDHFLEEIKIPNP